MTGCLFWQKWSPFNRFQSPALRLGGGPHRAGVVGARWGANTSMRIAGSWGVTALGRLRRGAALQHTCPRVRTHMCVPTVPRALADSPGMCTHTWHGHRWLPHGHRCTPALSHTCWLARTRARSHAPPAPAPSCGPGLSWSLGSPGAISKEAVYKKKMLVKK